MLRVSLLCRGAARTQSIGNLPPSEFELLYYRQLDESATAA
jgi:hypothetical protein